MLLAINFQQPKAVTVDQDIGISYTIADNFNIPQTFVSPASPAPVVVYLGDSYVYPSEFQINYSVDWLDQNINITTSEIIAMNIDLRKHGTSLQNYTSTNVNSNPVRNLLRDDEDKEADLTRLDIGEINNSNIISV